MATCVDAEVVVVCGVHVLACPRENTLARLILRDGQGWGTGVHVGYNRETYL
jgi:hypothetical protein